MQEFIKTTIRLEARLKRGLDILCAESLISQNKLMNQAIQMFVNKKIKETEDNLESTLNNLRAYREKDPLYEKAIDNFVAAEIENHEDPAEGRIVECNKSSTESKILDLLSG